MSALKIGDRVNTTLSASGAAKWINCPPSARLEQKFEKDPDTDYILEGNLAHAIGELELRFFNKEFDQKIYNKEIKKLRANRVYFDGIEGEVEKYVDYVKECVSEAGASGATVTLLVEHRLDFTRYVDNGRGIADVLILADNYIKGVDLKFGQGDVVSAKENPQMRLYAVALFEAFDMVYEFDDVTMAIVQPRRDHIDSETLTPDELIDWASNIAKPAADLAQYGLGDFAAGPWCKRCRAAPMCRTLAEKNKELAAYDFRDPELLSPDELIGIFKQQPMLSDWVKEVAAYVLKRALAGQNWPGFKVVEGRSNRTWTNAETVQSNLIDAGYTEDDFLNKKMKGIGDIEKLTGKEFFNTYFQDLVIKPTGAPTLAHESDRREAFGIATAKSDFANPL